MKTIVMPAGFQAAGVHAGIKKGGSRDMAMIVSDVPCAAAAVFTTNQVAAAPVKVSRQHINSGVAQAIVMNSGNANACTGDAGMRDAKSMTELTAEQIGCPSEDVLVCSTGHIGDSLPMDKIEKGIELLAAALSYDGGEDAVHAIMTTDTVPKYWSVQMMIDEQSVTVFGMAKGAGMIEPNMATMLSFLLTDAVIDSVALQGVLTSAVNDSFNRISVDGDRSTNDTVFLLANGQADHTPLSVDHPQWGSFVEAVKEVTRELAFQIVKDGEGAEKFVTINVSGAAGDDDADAAARAVANSFLVKTSWVGKEANWGRVMDAIGYSRAKVKEDKVDISYDDVPAVRCGVAAGTPDNVLSKIVAKSEFSININLNLGDGHAVVYTCECTEEYVRINM
ncbi:MAG: bifunctional glutamate N-acetyltransferase/amino-acid acetyltransferase ArgJ [Verrucomicrobia bacterium]|nr:bifunctional glutamate N-acetyltransferase/amino-acid acetyltransferase ArgJ [Verrucomicrobiota bacterium]